MNACNSPLFNWQSSDMDSEFAEIDSNEELSELSDYEDPLTDVCLNQQMNGSRIKHCLKCLTEHHNHHKYHQVACTITTHVDFHDCAYFPGGNWRDPGNSPD